jgi:hypothetical protein
MTAPATSRRLAAVRTRSGEFGNARTVVLVVVFFALGLAVSALLLRHPATPVATGTQQIELSQSSRKVLERLGQPVEVRFYSILDPGSGANLRAFSDHVEQLLTAYAQTAPGKVMLVPQTNINPNAAMANGIKGFDLDKGEGCYLGITFSAAGKKEVLARLSPEWESALEADISRSIERVAGSDSRSKPAAKPTAEDASIAEQIKHDIPNLQSLSLEDAIRVLRENSVKEFATTATKMNERVQQATEDLVKAQKEGSVADQQAALKRLQAAQAEETQALNKIAADSQLRIDSLKRLKAGAGGN